MRIPAAVSWSLVIVLGIASAVLWRELHAERQLTAGLREELLAARTAPAARPQPAVAVNESPAMPASVPPTTQPAKTAAQAATAVLMTESAKRQKTLLEDSEFRRARIAELRGNIQLRFPDLARDLGLSSQEADALLTQLAGYQLRQEAAQADVLAAGSSPGGITAAEFTRAQQELEQQHEAAMAALIGPERAAAYQEYEQTAASRRRVTNLGSMLTQAGRPLTSEQSKSLSALLIAEQRRQENEARTAAPVTSAQAFQQEQAERAIESDRRALAAAAAFLDARQIELVRARFEQVAGRTRAAASVQQREIEVAVQQQGAAGN